MSLSRRLLRFALPSKRAVARAAWGYLLWIGLGTYFVVALAYLGLRYWVAPNIDDWRPYIVQQFSQRFGVELSVEQLRLSWSGSGPSFSMQSVQLSNGEGGNVLTLPQVRGRLSWQGLWRGEPHFRELELDGLELAVHRSKDNTLTLFTDTQEHEDEQEEDPGVGLSHPLVQWLSRQTLVVFRDARLVWTDDMRDGRPLALRDVTVAWRSEGARYLVDVAGRPPQEIGKGFHLKGEFTLAGEPADMQDPKAWNARLYVAAQEVVPQAWRAWVDIPEQIESGELSAQWWLDISRGEPAGMAVDAALKQGRWRVSEQASVDVASARMVVHGDWRAYMGVYDASAEPAGADGEVSLSLALQGLQLALPDVFQDTLAVDELGLDGNLGRDEAGKMRLRLDHARIRNADMDVALAGAWRPDEHSEAGWADLQGVFERADMAAIQRYLPLTVEAEARDWMRHGLLGGKISQAHFLVRGELDDFPFGDEQAPDATGAWRLDGAYEGAVIDYVPAEGKKKGWPRLEAASGRLSMRGNDLRVTADSAVAHPEPDKPIKLHEVQAHIPDLARQTTLNLQGRTEAEAPAYLALMRGTPLGGWLGGTFDDSRAQGQWQVPLRLTIPLLNADDTRVRGQLIANGGKLWLLNGLPALEQVKGTLDFSEWGATTQGMEARFLGGPLTLRGGLGKGQTALGAAGRATVPAVKQAFGLEELEPLSGELAYQLRLERTAGGRYGLALSSNLVGLAAALPEPWNKPAQANWPLSVRWQPQGNGRAMMLDVDMGVHGQARFLHDPARRQAYFHAGAVGVGRSASLPEQGLAVDMQAERFDMEAWEKLLLFLPDAKTGGVPVWPDLASVRVQAAHLRMRGLGMDQATVTVRHEADGQWRLDLSSTQTAGTVFWRQAQGAVEGKVRAHLARLAIGEKDAKAEAAQGDDTEWEVADELDLPGIQLQVDRFVVDGRHLGSLSVDGVNESRGRLWRLEALTLKSPSLALSGHGEWHLDGDERGLALTADAKIEDAGAYLKQAGLEDMLEGGRGTLAMQLQWRHMPWRFNVDDVQGTVKLALRDGRFSAVRSRSVKLLELLSMQSLQRVLSLDIRPGSMFASGFPFDTWSGSLHMGDGLIQTNDYRVEGPAGAISLAGSTRWRTEELDLQAMVVPKLDVSGASLAAGLVNPVVGLGAFLTQWVLREPLSRAMTVHYEVKGTWKEPKMKEVSVSEAAAADTDSRSKR